MGSQLYDPPSVYDRDLLRVPHGGQTMGDGDQRLFPGQLFDGRQQLMLVFRVYAGSSLVQYDDRRVFQDSLAMEILCFSPPDRVEPPSPTTVA